MTEKVIDVDEQVLDAARAHLGTLTIKDTVDQALRRVAGDRTSELANALDVLGSADLEIGFSARTDAEWSALTGACALSLR